MGCQPAAIGAGVGMAAQKPGLQRPAADTWLKTSSSKDALEIPEQGGGR